MADPEGVQGVRSNPPLRPNYFLTNSKRVRRLISLGFCHWSKIDVNFELRFMKISAVII